MTTENKYNAQEIAAFEEKEKRIVRQSCLNRAVEITISLWTHPSVKLTDVNVEKLNTEGVPRICELADKFVDWVYQKNVPIVKDSMPNTEIPKKEATNETLPTPTLEQKMVFDKIVADLGLEYEYVVREIWNKKHSLVVENLSAAEKYLLSIKKEQK